MYTKELRYGKLVENKVFFIRQIDRLGIKRKYTGYYQLIDIMHVLINENLRVKSFSRQVYPLIAKEYGKPGWTIERNIRSLINKCWCDEMMEKLNVYYPTNKKPTCCKFMHMVKDYILKQIS